MGEGERPGRRLLRPRASLPPLPPDNLRLRVGDARFDGPAKAVVRAAGTAALLVVGQRKN
ncbi:hypothetical protein OG749_06330 [Streptomyces nojiriensis]|uniref:hypothetical protein n=1 Tax=Streptomyces nojiriensis TaxID=66374 RepID=UPI002E1979BF